MNSGVDNNKPSDRPKQGPVATGTGNLRRSSSGQGDAGGDVGLDAAYGLATPDDNRRLYKSWAASYDSDFIDRHQYVYHREVAAALIWVADGRSIEPILDVGCGTGVIGSALWEEGVRDIHGLDISPEMLAEAAARTASDGEAVYRSLVEADLTQALNVPSDRFGAIVSSGTFTHGHVGPEALNELIRIVRPGGVLCLGVNEQFYQASGFQRKLAGLADTGLLADCKVASARIYDDPPAGHEADTALAVTLVLPA